MRLKTKLLALLLPLLVLPLLALAWVAYAQLSALAEEKSEREIATILDQMLLQSQDILATAKANIQLFANSGQLQAYLLTENESDRYLLLQPSLLRLLASYQDAYPEYYEVRVILPDGYEDTRSATSIETNLSEDESGTEWWKSLSSTQEDVFVQFAENPDDGRFVAYVAKPILLKHAASDPILARPYLRGYIVITVNLDRFLQRIADSVIDSSGYMIAVDSRGVIRAHATSERVGAHVEAPLFEAMLGAAGTGDELVSLFEGQEAHIQGKRLGFNLWLFAAYPSSEFITAGKKLAVVVAAITSLAIAVTAGLLFVFLNTVFLTPVRDLRDATRQIGEGNLLVDVDVTASDELGDLARAFRDMGQSLHHSQEQIRYHAYHDTLTDLPNRFMFHEFLEQAVNRARRHQERLGILFADVDGFKRVNDTLGHHAGDELLQEISARIRSVVRHEDLVGRADDDSPNVVSRLGGDEFVVLLGELSSEIEATKVAKRIIDAVGRPYTLQGHEIYVGISIGIALYPENGDDAEQLLKSADKAMFHAKASGKNNFQFYDPKMNAMAINHLGLEADLHKAMASDELSMVYQPKIDLRTGYTVGAEALIRWRHPIEGMIPPSLFIPVAEETGLIGALGDWILRQTFAQVHDWHDTAAGNLIISINISSQQISNTGFSAHVAGILEETGARPERLDFELTETSVMRMEGYIDEALRSLRALGITLSLDDFGTGYSSLSHLRRFPIDYLKIDRSFVDEALTNPDDGAIVTAIIGMAKNLGLRVVAEGVETVEQGAMLWQCGCDFAQGYYYGKPMPAADLLQRLEDEHAALLEGGDSPVPAPNMKKPAQGGAG